MHPDKLINIQNLSQDRYGYFIRHVSDTQEVWLIQDEGQFVLLGDNEEKPAMPVWPEKEFAEMMLTGDWKDYSLEMVNVYDFVEWLNKLEEEGIQIAGFPMAMQNAVVVSANEMKNHLIYELQQYE